MRLSDLRNGAPRPKHSDWHEVHETDENWRQAIQHVLRGDVSRLEVLLKTGLNVEAVFSRNLLSAVEECLSLSEFKALQYQDEETGWEWENDCDEAITLLHAAAIANNVPIIRLLLHYGAEVNAVSRASFDPDSEMRTPIFEAVIGGNLEASTCLLDAGATPDGVHLGLLNLLSACMEGREVDTALPEVRRRLLVLLLDRGADPNMEYLEESERPIVTAIRLRRLDLAQELRLRGASCNLGTLFRIFVEVGGDAELLDFIVSLGTPEHDDVEGAFSSGCHGLKDERERLHAMGLVLRRFPTFVQSTNAAEVLCAVAQLGDIQIAELLLKHGVNVNCVNGGGMTPLHSAARVRSSQETKLAMLRWLLNNGANIQQRSKSDVSTGQLEGALTALHFAVERWHEVVVTFLLQAGADINAKCDRGQTPFLRFFMYGGRSGSYESKSSLDMIDILLYEGASVLTRDYQGHTALHLLALKTDMRDVEDRAKLAYALISCGADPHIPASNGKIPVEYALDAQDRRRNPLRYDGTMVDALRINTSDFLHVMQSMLGSGHSKAA